MRRFRTPRRVDPNRFFLTVQRWWAIVSALKRYPTGEDLFDVFRRVLILNSVNPAIAKTESWLTSQDCALLRPQFQKWFSFIHKRTPEESSALLSQNEHTLLFHKQMMFGVGVSLCTTRKSFVGAVPHMTLPQDVVVIPTSAEKPYILRESLKGMTGRSRS